LVEGNAEVWTRGKEEKETRVGSPRSEGIKFLPRDKREKPTEIAARDRDHDSSRPVKEGKRGARFRKYRVKGDT